jgi:hypothetical protein
MRYFSPLNLPLAELCRVAAIEAESDAGSYPDATAADPKLRRIMRESRGRVMRRARRDRIAEKRSFLA